MKKRIKTFGRLTKMKLPKLRLANPDDILNEYQTISEASKKSGYTPSAIRQWMRQKKIDGWLFQKLLVIKKDVKLPPSL